MEFKSVSTLEPAKVSDVKIAFHQKTKQNKMAHTGKGVGCDFPFHVNTCKLKGIFLYLLSRTDSQIKKEAEGDKDERKASLCM